MRLSQHELQEARSALYEMDPDGHLWLYGSRVNDEARGGDIDLYFESSRQVSMKQKLQLEYRLSSRCGVKVDLLVRNPEEAMQLIHQIAREGVRL